MDGVVERIKIYPEKGSAGLELSEGRLIENLGLEGDFHAKGGDRQISLLLAENFFKIQNKHGLCLSRFKENLCVRFPEPVVLKSGTRIEAGETILETSWETKHCHKECSLYESGKLCPLAGLNLFARVIKGGVIRIGDGVCIISSSGIL